MSLTEFRELVEELATFYQSNFTEKDGVYTCYFKEAFMIRMFSEAVKTHALDKKNKKICVLVDINVDEMKVVVAT